MSNTLTLVEKYRPRKFEDFVGNPDIAEKLAEKVRTKSMPHLLFYGDAGTGKTSMAFIMIRLLYKGKPHTYKEINASDKNGIDDIRKEVIPFAEYSDVQEDVDRGVDVPFKIIILDEVDEISGKAQAALRRTMEKYADHCRFILICNFEWKLIKPIQDRCEMIHFNHVEPAEMLPRLRFICDQEKIQIEDASLLWIAQKSDGSVRNAINTYLEACLTETSRTHQPITLQWLQKKANMSDDKLLEMFKLALNGKFTQARQSIIILLQKGENLREVLNHITEAFYNMPKFPDPMKGEIALSHMHAEAQIAEGCDKYVVMSGFIANLQQIGLKYKEIEIKHGVVKK